MKARAQIKFPESDREEASEAADQDPAIRVDLSQKGQFVSTLRAEARLCPSIREDIVAEVQKALEEGTFEDSVPMCDVLDAVLADL